MITGQINTAGRDGLVDDGLVDSHCHFDFEAFDADRDEVWQRCLEQNVRAIVVPGVSPEQWPRAASLAKNYCGVYFSAGLHPRWIEALCGEYNDVDDALRCLPEKAEPFLADAHCVAVGECGLDKHVSVPMDVQERFLAVHCKLANLSEKPLVIHSLKTHAKVLQVLKSYGCTRGVVHGFSGSAEQARSFIDLGFCLGVGGTITYARARKTRESIRQAPLDALLLETDAPDMPLFGKQGQRNSPTHVVDIARTLAELRGESYEHICLQTADNARRVFNISA